MKSIVLLCLVAVAAAAPPAAYGDAQVLKYNNENSGTGNYNYEFDQSDGTKVQATGELHPGNGKDNEGYVSVRGSFEWVGPDGVTYTGTYVADENGYHPQYTQGPNGVIPAEVLKSYASHK